MGIPWGELASIGFPGLVTVFVLLVFFGFLIPAREARYWREAFFKEQEMRRDMEVTGRLQRKVFDSIPTGPEEEGEE